VPFYVVGGEYADTSFAEVVRAEPVLGPFATYQEAFVAWRARAVATIDQAYTRFQILRSDSPPHLPADS
jgi:hypothetical protein